MDQHASERSVSRQEAVVADDILDLRLETSSDIPVLFVRGEVDLTCADAIHQAVSDMAIQSSLRYGIVDLSGVTFIDVVGFDVLTDAAEKAAEVGCVAMFRNPSGPVRRLQSLLPHQHRRDSDADLHHWSN